MKRAIQTTISFCKRPREITSASSSATDSEATPELLTVSSVNISPAPALTPSPSLVEEDADREGDEDVNNGTTTPLLQGVDEVDPGLVCPRLECLAGRAELLAMQANLEKKERESLLLKKIKVQVRKLRCYQKVVREMREGAACSRGVESVVEEVVVVERVVQRVEEQDERVEELDERVEELDERVAERVEEGVEEAGPSRSQVEETLRGAFEGTGRGAAMRHLVLPPSIVGKSDLASWLFLDDMPRIQKYASQLMRELNEVTTIQFYHQNIVQFLAYLQETPPRSCRLRRTQVLGITRVVQRALKQLGRAVVTHQLKVKARKMKNIISRSSLLRCQDQARLAIPELPSKTLFIPKL
ncbi:hypothetical protein EYF80_058024 [Liparis tanakae]|uniref:Uncharacterized protein n=1 Tax=Liparis tanakae TaxID=230148 RepID=A0A4Z2ESP7_9TELE|nr:hypothetical protein EYF80_058024 [Liparis tanakae]